jgi:hypothetical protein
MSMVSAEGDGGSIFFIPKDKRKEGEKSRQRFASASGDLITLLRVYQGWNANKNHSAKVKWCHDHFINWRTMEKAGNIRRQLRQICVRMALPLQSATHKDHHYTSLRRWVYGDFEAAGFAELLQVIHLPPPLTVVFVVFSGVLSQECSTTLLFDRAISLRSNCVRWERACTRLSVG